ncbi:hypothetical protein EX30DRAFT_343948 [Ascodesmis nigricans]|uniref:Uncharacterized protein n=1 Tax=Ascodesmis nigricans TaxID=341454 RepID=A0A4S2MKQ2_9PEZI|nr:hypothetical protein EX30DRAFT_343948 [Ascodesmis nigricans]
MLRRDCRVSNHQTSYMISASVLLSTGDLEFPLFFMIFTITITIMEPPPTQLPRHRAHILLLTTDPMQEHLNSALSTRRRRRIRAFASSRRHVSTA